MKQVISVRDLQEMLRHGQNIRVLPEDALLTPSARDFLRDYETNGRSQPLPVAPTPRAAEAAPASAPTGALKNHGVTSRSPRGQIEAFFNSPEIAAIKDRICEIGRRMWQRAYVDGNGGNIAVRVGEDLVVCTPTLISKGFMQPADLCLVDLEGNQLCGDKARTSEILMHLQIMKRQPRAIATAHCHPPYSTGFAVAGVQPPTRMIPEFEVFVSVAIAPYRTPGTPEMGQLVADLVDQHNTILMANHGVVSWSHVGVEDAYWKMEIIEAYCRTVLVASQLGTPAKTMTPAQLQDLLKIKQNLGIPDPRFGLKECELGDNDAWHPGVTCTVPREPSDTDAPLDPQAEAIVKAITERILSGNA
jgi:L-fuculose-phosphate aldolase